MSQKQDPIDRIDMIAQVWENKVFGKENNKEKYLKKIPNRFVKKDQNQFPKDSLFFDFSNTLRKQIKDKIFRLKNFF